VNAPGCARRVNTGLARRVNAPGVFKFDRTLASAKHSERSLCFWEASFAEKFVSCPACVKLIASKKSRVPLPCSSPAYSRL